MIRLILLLATMAWAPSFLWFVFHGPDRWTLRAAAAFALCVGSAVVALIAGFFLSIEGLP